MPISRNGFTGRKSDIGTTPARVISDQSVVVNEGLQILASPNNSETIYVGYSSGITANSADSTDGFPLVPGASLFLPCRHPADVYVRSSTLSSQVIWFASQ